MTVNCKIEWERLVKYAEGDDDPGLGQHIEGCSACLPAVQWLRSIFATASMPIASAPATVISRAHHIFVPKPSRMARLTFSTLRASGLRSAPAEEFQLSFEFEQYRARLNYEPIALGWKVQGNVSNGSGVVARGPDVISDSLEFFEFEAENLSATGLTVGTSTALFAIPSAAEALKNDGD